MSPKVSIIIPTYNRAHYLPEALESALQQTYSNLEIIVVNDGSTDETEKVLSPYMKHIRYIKQENGGCAAAKNTGLEYATGAFITNLDDDDRILPEKIQRQVEIFQQRPNLGICGTGVNFIDAQGKITSHYIPQPFSKKFQILQLLRKCLLIQSSVMIHRKCHDHLGNYKLQNGQDYDFWLRVSLHYEIGVIPELLTEYRSHGNQITGQSNRHRVSADVARSIEDFLTHVSIEQIIPDLRSIPYAHALLGLILCEQGVFSLAQIYFEQALKTSAGHFGLGMLRLHQKELTEAKAHFEHVLASKGPFASRVDEAFLLIERIEAIVQNKELCNTSSEVVHLRKDFSYFGASIMRQLLNLARREDGPSC